MAEGVHKITCLFEEALSKYTGAPYVVAVDNQSNALYLTLIYQKIKGKKIGIPSRTYPSVPCEIIRAGGIVDFIKPTDNKTTLKGAYPLLGTKTWDAALSFTHNMYIPDTYMCISFTGPYKTLKLSKGGAILTDNYEAYLWFKRARFSGRRESSYHDDHFDMIGINCYMMPELAARGLLLINQFYNPESGKPLDVPDVEMPYPDLSQFPVYTDPNFDVWGLK
jgi:hypothetical protein